MSSLFDVEGAGSRRERFKTLYEENYHRVLGYALRRAGREDAADVVAETFLVAWRLWRTCHPARRPDCGCTEPRVACSPIISAEIAVESGCFGASEPKAGSAAKRIRTMLACSPRLRRSTRLRDRDRELLALVAWEGLDAAEIAQVLCCSRNAARIRIHRARRRFARELTSVGSSAKQNAGAGHVSEAYE